MKNQAQPVRHWRCSFLVPCGAVRGAILLLSIIWMINGHTVIAQRGQGVQDREIQVTLGTQLTDAPVDGRLLVLFSKKASPPPINGPNWFQPEPFYGMDVRGVAPGSVMVIDQGATGFPGKLSELASGQWHVQAILHRDFEFADHKNGPSNLYSSVASLNVVADRSFSVKLTLNFVVGRTPYPETKFAKVVQRKSPLLSAFHNRDVIERALVLLPKSYLDDPSRRYPVYYEVSGFGGTIKQFQARNSHSKVQSDGVEFIHVMLSGQCKWGHHVYADSATNGPRSRAFVEEMVPAIDQQFRTLANANSRFLGGHSSGGWSSLWLQIQHPQTFGGVWSTAPDPVDFRDWQGTALYQPNANVYRSGSNDRTPLARMGGRVMLWYDGFTKMDDALGHGGQIRSFEAVFSPRGDDGLPVKCWDRQTGVVNPEVVEAWKKYDISLQLQKNWSTLKPHIQGKLHVYMGTQDTFYLERAVEFLKDRMAALGSDAKIELLSGKNHFNLVDASMRSRIYSEMAQQFKRRSK